MNHLSARRRSPRADILFAFDLNRYLSLYQGFHSDACEGGFVGAGFSPPSSIDDFSRPYVGILKKKYNPRKKKIISGAHPARNGGNCPTPPIAVNSSAPNQ
jgi:hypothetical protein